ncbi:PQQ-binding-like beta-propeller repeat protein [Streptomyces sp. V1I1]|uniref:PQQ-binding-like beta-propeller repeat protein n=1 Tax=Streptomyces sp. V1I1 TaxID=3042272 RepID=UPI0027D83A98|nr:PQQ-binding-like beta-propeller repeat protein [Streptomyces sp. V1I1]
MDGRKVWQDPSGAKVVSAPIIHGDRVYIGGKNLTSRPLFDGKEIWAVKPHKGYDGTLETWASPTVVDNSVYAMIGRGRVGAQRVPGVGAGGGSDPDPAVYLGVISLAP